MGTERHRPRQCGLKIVDTKTAGDVMHGPMRLRDTATRGRRVLARGHGVGGAWARARFRAPRARGAARRRERTNAACCSGQCHGNCTRPPPVNDPAPTPNYHDAKSPPLTLLVASSRMQAAS